MTAEQLLTEAGLADSHWGRRIIAAEQRGGFTEQDERDATGWATCHCSRLDPRLLWPASSVPRDRELVTLGSGFAGLVDRYLNRFEPAAAQLIAIERRAAKLLAEQAAGEAGDLAEARAALAAAEAREGALLAACRAMRGRLLAAIESAPDADLSEFDQGQEQAWSEAADDLAELMGLPRCPDCDTRGVDGECPECGACLAATPPPDSGSKLLELLAELGASDSSLSAIADRLAELGREYQHAATRGAQEAWRMAARRLREALGLPPREEG